MSKGTILIVEDNQLNLDMASDLLKRAGFQTLEAIDADSGITLAKSHHPDLILMDMHLPIKNGYEASKAIKTDPSTHDIPVVAFTALAMEEEQRKAIDHGCSGIICKPIDVDNFAKTVASYIGQADPALPSSVFTTRQTGETSVPQAPPKEDTKLQTVLIVDDHQQNRELLKELLTHLHLNCLLASNGAEALELAQAHHPDTILLDIMMPGMNGYQVMEKLKEMPDLADTPVIFISSLNDTDHIVKALNQGGYDYITKPFQVEEVQARVSATLRAKRLQEAYRQKAEEAERVRREMEEFLFIASHDLQAPLRKILQFTEFLKRPASVPQSLSQTDFLQSIERNAREMDGLLRDLLVLSRVNRKGGTVHANLPLTEPVQAVVNELQESIAEEQATVEVGELPHVDMDARQMKMVFSELIKNALKFHPADRPPRIRIYSESQDHNGYSITVEDNGIGFDEAHTERIFQPMQRLHGAGHYLGSGMGLAIVKRIIERHQGHITVHSQPGEGSRFVLHLPRPAQSAQAT